MFFFTSNADIWSNFIIILIQGLKNGRPENRTAVNIKLIT
jgi:hypothetical protein